MVEAAGVDPANLTWHPTDPAADTFLPAARRLTRDSAGRSADQPGFDPGAIPQYGFNAARDLQAIYFSFAGSGGGRIQAPDDTLTFTDPKTVEAFAYLVDLVNTHHVAPSAADTNDNGDFSRDQFIQGKMALFQSGTYNLKNIADGATFEWGIAPLLAGPEGRVSAELSRDLQVQERHVHEPGGQERGVPELREPAQGPATAIRVASVHS
jgi:multiple sugar transport system substrate-binding protein